MIDYIPPTYMWENNTWRVNVNDSSQGTKHDQEKTRLDLLDAEFLEAVGLVLAFGAKKYAANNWRRGINICRLLGSLLRHIMALMRGEDFDNESGLPHTAHIGCNAMFLHWTLKNRPDLDDRYKGN